MCYGGMLLAIIYLYYLFNNVQHRADYFSIVAKVHGHFDPSSSALDAGYTIIVHRVCLKCKYVYEKNHVGSI